MNILKLLQIFTNIHSFLVIATNHCGEDLYRFKHVYNYSEILDKIKQTVGIDVVDVLARQTQGGSK